MNHQKSKRKLKLKPYLKKKNKNIKRIFMTKQLFLYNINKSHKIIKFT